MKQIRSSEINGKITAPHSKSVFQRTVFASVIANGTTRLFHQTLCQDDHAALNIAKCLNAKIVEKDDHILINGPARPKDSVINCGESGLSIRMA